MTRTVPAAGEGDCSPAPAAAASRIFISYRRRDAKHAARALHERLSEHFGEERVFMDLHDIGGGVDFVDVICRELETCGAVVVVIGEHWLTAEEGGRRLDDPNDFVRMEVRLALARGAFVVPVLVDGAKMPGGRDLPDDIKPLARINAKVLSDHHWPDDVGHLILTLEDGWRVPWYTRLWRRRSVRITVAALALAAALFAQYRVAYRPRPVSLASTELFSPVVARRGLEELVIEGPLTNSDEGLLFSHQGRPDEFVDLFFERARLGEDTLALLAALAADPPRDAAALDLQTLEPKQSREAEEGPASSAASLSRTRDAGGETCRTSVDVRAAPGPSPPAALHLYQLDRAVSERVRQFNLKAEGGELHVSVLTATPYKAEGGGPHVSNPTATPDDRSHESLGCRKRLSIGEAFEDFFNGTFIVHAVAEAGGSLRLSFNAATPGGPPPGRTRNLFRPFELGGGTPKPDGPAPLRAAAVYLRPLGGEPSTRQFRTLGARAAGRSPLNIDGLEVGPEQIQLNVSGWALVKNGAVDYVNLTDRFKRQPYVAALFIIFDLALLTWLLMLIFGARRRHT
jgi:TIR domain